MPREGGFAFSALPPVGPLSLADGAPLGHAELDRLARLSQIESSRALAQQRNAETSAFISQPAYDNLILSHDRCLRVGRGACAHPAEDGPAIGAFRKSVLRGKICCDPVALGLPRSATKVPPEC